MQKLNVTIQCLATYDSSILVPDGLTLEEAVQYAKKHINEIKIGELYYVPYSDDLDEESCNFSEEE